MVSGYETPATRLVPKPQLLLASDRSSAALENLHHLSWVTLWQTQHSIFGNPCWQEDSQGKIGYLCQKMRHGSRICSNAGVFVRISEKLMHTSVSHPTDPHPRESDAETQVGYLWPGCSSSWRVFLSLWLNFKHNWDLQSCPEWRSWISMKPTLTRCNSFWMYHFNPGTPQERKICHCSACTSDIGCPSHLASANYMNRCLIGMWRLPLKRLQLSDPCELSVGWRLPCTIRPQMDRPGHSVTSLRLILSK